MESPKGKAIGTGFIVSKNKLLTCYHVLQNSLEAWARFNYNSQNTACDTNAFIMPLDLSLDTMICSSINDLDYALVRLQNPTSQVILPLNLQEINTGDNIRIIHHPNGDLATVSTLGKIEELSHDLLLHSLTTDQGSSGAPIFNENWEVIAIHRGNIGIMAAQTTEKMTAIPINSFLDKIASNLDSNR
nr:serine protease [Okeania sp. SIO3I5]